MKRPKGPNRGDFYFVRRRTEPHEGWIVLDKTTPSGKQLFECKTCGRESVGPDKECPVMKDGVSGGG